MSNAYISIYMHVTPGNMPPRELVCQVIARYGQTFSSACSKPDPKLKGKKRLYIVRSTKTRPLENIMEALEANKKYQRLLVFGGSTGKNDIRYEDLQPFNIIEGKGPGRSFIACLGGVYADRDEVPLSREYTAWQQLYVPKLAELYTPTLSDAENFEGWKNNFDGNELIEHNCTVMTIMSASGEVLSIKASNARTVERDWGMLSLDLNARAETVLTSRRVSVGSTISYEIGERETREAALEAAAVRELTSKIWMGLFYLLLTGLVLYCLFGPSTEVKHTVACSRTPIGETCKFIDPTGKEEPYYIVNDFTRGEAKLMQNGKEKYPHSHNSLIEENNYNYYIKNAPNSEKAFKLDTWRRIQEVQGGGR